MAFALAPARIAEVRGMSCSDMEVDSPASAARESQTWCRFADDATGRAYRVRMQARDALGVPSKPLAASVALEPPTMELQASNRNSVLFRVAMPALAVDPYVVLPEGESSFEADRTPFRGYWWPWSSNSVARPLTKYDTWVQALGRTQPSSVEWEGENHARGASRWSGHCNGWAASSLLYAEPLRSVQHSGVDFSVSDIKGLLASASFCVRYSFHGKRYRSSADDARDIDPKLFHTTLVDNLGNRRRALAVDTDPREEVSNQVISAARFRTTRLAESSAVRSVYDVQADLYIHIYEGHASDSPGVAPGSWHSFRYRLETDSAGVIQSGTWEASSDNPDFLWVPLAQAECGRENPHVKATDLEILLEAATKETL